MNVIGVIPARYASTRFPGKPLIDLCGKTMLRRVIEAALRAETLDEVLVATDDGRIAREAEAAGATVAMPEGDFASGTDRIAAALNTSRSHANIVVNIQGDEPLLASELIDILVRELIASDADVTTPVTPIFSPEELSNSSVVKAILAANGRAMYFTRSAAPYIRGATPEHWPGRGLHFRHIGIYAYRRAALDRFIQLPPSPTELAEQLEQLRLLEDGAHYRCILTSAVSAAVDTPADADAVRQIHMRGG